MTRVAVVDPSDPSLLRTGESNLKRVDGLWVSVEFDAGCSTVNRQLINAACVYAEEAGPIVQAAFIAMREERKAMESRHYQQAMELFREHGA